MRLGILSALLTSVFVSSVFAEIKTQQIDYKMGDQTFSGYLAYDDATQDKRPGIVVVHEWWGHNEYVHKRAEQLAKLGYIAFALDMYGKGKITDDPKQAGEWAGDCYKSPQVMVERFKAGLEVLKQQPQADTNRIAAIGYCFGGSTVLNAARAGLDLKGVVSFHGALKNPGLDAAAPLKTKILVCHGSDDAFESPEEIEGFKKEMTDVKADLTFKVYPGAVHAFTNPEADSHHMKGVAYNEAADKASWEDMKRFLQSLFK